MLFPSSLALSFLVPAGSKSVALNPENLPGKQQLLFTPWPYFLFLNVWDGWICWLGGAHRRPESWENKSLTRPSLCWRVLFAGHSLCNDYSGWLPFYHLKQSLFLHVENIQSSISPPPVTVSTRDCEHDCTTKGSSIPRGLFACERPAATSLRHKTWLITRWCIQHL